MTVREPQPGEVLGQSYLLDKELGRGGFGVVFKARHLTIERIVAIKVLLATFAKKDPTAKERFRREATIAASLDYPNSLRIFDYGETDEGVFYLVMEYLQGQELAKLIRTAGPLPIPRSVHIIRQVLHALMEAHSRGIVHRDIKPDNVMLISLAYDPDYVKVMDFGIAKMADAGEQITRAGITLGTPRYMPIEQLKGERLTPSTDLYAVGLVLYEMLIGKPAFDGESAVDIALTVMRGGTLKVPADAGLPPEVAALIEKASAREPEDRFQSAREMLEAMNALPPSLLDGDAADRERFITRGTSSRRRPTASVIVGESAPSLDHAPSTLMLDRMTDEPGQAVEEDREDVIKTMAIDALTESSNMPRAAREAKTMALDVETMSPAESTGPSSRREADVTGSIDATRSVSIEVPRFDPGPPPRSSPPPGPPWFGAPPILVVMNAAILMFALIILLRSL